MPKPSAPQTFTDGSDYVASASTNANNQLWYNALNNSVLYQDVAGTVTVSHTWTATQSFPAGSTISGYLPLSGGTLTGGLSGTTLSLSSTLTVAGAIAANGSITVAGGAALNGPGNGAGYILARNAANSAYVDLLYMNASDAAVIPRALNVSGALSVTGASTLSANLTVGTGITVTTGGIHVAAGPTQLDSTLTVTGATTLSGGATLGAALAMGAFGISANNYSITAAGVMTVNGGASFGSTLSVTGVVAMNSTATVSGNLGVGGNCNVTGGITVGATLAVTGAATLSAALQHSGSTAGFFGTAARAKAGLTYPTGYTLGAFESAVLQILSNYGLLAYNQSGASWILS
jgi:filamentous hemagglutinin